DQPELAPALVLDEPVAVRITVALDPGQRREGVRPQPVDQLAVAGPGVRLTEQDQPERRGVSRSVVGGVGNLAGARQLAGAQLVEDLAWLGVAPVVPLGGLE